jgi:hypothetical protein
VVVPLRVPLSVSLRLPLSLTGAINARCATVNELLPLSLTGAISAKNAEANVEHPGTPPFPIPIISEHMIIPVESSKPLTLPDIG